MTHQHESKKETLKDKIKEDLQPDPETLHTTDPQEHMRGPISSWMHHIEKNAEKADYETPPTAKDQDDDVAEKTE